MLYTDFIRKKMHNLSKIITASGYPLKIISKFNRKAVDYVIHGKTQPGKNLLPYPYTDTTKTTNGVTFTDNGDGTITVNGTATANAYYLLNNNLSGILDKNKKYVLSADCFFKSKSYFYITLYNNDTRVEEFGWQNADVVVDLSQYEYTRITCRICALKGAVLDNAVFKPMIELGETASEYEPYSEYDYKIPIKNTHGDTSGTLEIYTNSQLKDGESISFRKNGLPELKLYKGENNITVETDIKPTSMDIRYYN